MSHSTHVGFNCPPFPAPIILASSSVVASFSFSHDPVPPHIPLHRGVGQSFCSIATAHPSLFGLPRPSPEHVSPGFPARGVGQCATVPKFGLFRFPCVGPVSFQSRLFGVGKYPYPLPQVRRSGVGSGNNSPRRIVPQRGKVSEYDIKPPKSEHWAVLHPYEAGLYLADDPGVLGPQSAALAVSDPCAFAGGRYVLTGESP